MSKVDMTSFVDAEQALNQAAIALKKIGSSSELLQTTEARTKELLSACESIVSASEVIRAKGAAAMRTIADVDLKGNVDLISKQVREIDETISTESKESLKRYSEFNSSIRTEISSMKESLIQSETRTQNEMREFGRLIGEAKSSIKSTEEKLQKASRLNLMLISLNILITALAVLKIITSK